MRFSVLCHKTIKTCDYTTDFGKFLTNLSLEEAGLVPNGSGIRCGGKPKTT